jgi:hypothetical protein
MLTMIRLSEEQALAVIASLANQLRDRTRRGEGVELYFGDRQYVTFNVTFEKEPCSVSRKEY